MPFTHARNFLLFIIVGLGLLPRAMAEVGSAPQAPNFSTPENALRSYWATKDWYSINRRPSVLEKTSTDQALFLRKMAEVTTGETQKYFSSWQPSPPDKVSRTIKSTSEESPSRVAIVVNLKNTTPIPAGAAPSKSEMSVREAGQDYKYVIDKRNDTWKVSEVWRLGLPGIPSRAYQAYVMSPTPRFPSSVYED